MFDLPLSCKTCGKQYTGNTANHFRSRCNYYKTNVRKAKSSNMENLNQIFLQSHSLHNDHQGFLKDVD